MELHYQPRDKRRRDADNIVPTLKPLCDALAKGTVKHPGYGIVEDDTPDQMIKKMPVIHPAVKGEPPRMWMTITERKTVEKDTKITMPVVYQDLHDFDVEEIVEFTNYDGESWGKTSDGEWVMIYD